MNALNLLSRSRFLRDSVTIATGTGIAQLILILSSPIITRQYGPEAFGVLGIFTSLIAIVSPVATLTYEDAIIVPSSDKEAAQLLVLSLLIGTCSALLFSGVVISYHQIINAFGFKIASFYLFLIPVVVFCDVVSRSLERWLIRAREFNSIQMIEVSRAVATSGSKICLGLIAPTAPVLVALETAGHVFRAALFLIKTRNSLPDGNLLSLILHQKYIKALSLLALVRKYRDFSIYRAPSILLAAITVGTPTVLLASFFGPSAAGFYALSMRILQMPTVLIAESVGKAFLPRIATAVQQNRNPRSFIVKTTAALACIGAIPFGSIILFGPWLFGMVFGLNWVKAGLYARWLSLPLYVWFISVPCLNAIPVLRLQAQDLVFTAFISGARILMLVLGALLFKNDIVSVALLSLSHALIAIGRNIWVISVSENCIIGRSQLTGEGPWEGQ